MTTLKSRLLGLAASLALILLVAGTPTLLIAIGTVPKFGDFTPSRLTSPDDGTLALAVIAVVAWLAWLVFAASVAMELLARLRGMPAPRLPGLALPQLTAGRLIALASLLFVAVPAPTPVLPAPPALAAAPTVAPPDTAPTPQRDVAAAPAGTPPAVQSDEDKHQTPTVPYTVRRGDSLWKIAEQHLGDGRRYDEIVALNETILHGRPDFITPGTELRIPRHTPSPDDGEYVVQPGDTLSEIAQDQLGDANAYPRIAAASRDTVQPDGQQLTAPDLILPGWHLTIPGREHSHPQPPPPVKEPGPQRPVEPPRSETTIPPPTPPSPSGEDAAAPAAEDEGTAVPGWVLPGLAGAGALLAGSLLLVLRQHRRTQARYRRPGRIIAPAPPDLQPVEKTAHLTGTVTAPRIDVLDQALSSLAERATEPPRLRTVELDTDRITLRLAEPADLPEPWTGAAISWYTTLDNDFPDASGELAPYPLLVSFGQARNGALVLVNLEELHTATVTGDPETATALGRHITAELSLNPWSTLVEIDTLGIGSELATIDPLRLHHHDDADTPFLDRLATELEVESAQDPDRFRALVTTGSHADDEAVRKVAKIITSCAGRPGAAIVTISGKLGADDTEIHVTSAGRLRIDDLDLSAAGLAAEEAAACAMIVDLTRDADNAPVPLATGSGDHRPPADQAGALRPEVTEPRPDGPAGDRSLLPLASSTYENDAATTADDIDELAPLVQPAAQDKVADKDPDLDDDLTLWTDPNSTVPRLTLLGPVNARTNGDAKAVARRKPFYVELLAYLALHPNGVTTPEVCDAFGLKPDRARTDLGVVRRWLGHDPRTGELHLPSARARQSHDQRGTAIYQVQGIVTDLDLFRRLRSRGQSRGDEGIADLVTALGLVSGEPFTELRPAGWSWLLDGDRIDHIMTCAIVDVAHIVTMHALTVEDFDLARLAAETSYSAAPDDETSRLDLIAVAAATGHADLAERQLIEGIFNRSDNNLGPVALPDRTAGIVRKRGWDRVPPKARR